MEFKNQALKKFQFFLAVVTPEVLKGSPPKKKNSAHSVQPFVIYTNKYIYLLYSFSKIRKLLAFNILFKERISVNLILIYYFVSLLAYCICIMYISGQARIIYVVNLLRAKGYVM